MSVALRGATEGLDLRPLSPCDVELEPESEPLGDAAVLQIRVSAPSPQLVTLSSRSSDFLE